MASKTFAKEQRPLLDADIDEIQAFEEDFDFD